jgi:hypothetical protein
LKDENDTSLIYYKKAETINKDVNNNYYNYQIFSGKIIVKYRKLQKEIKKPFLKNKSVENRINDILLDIDDLTKNSYFSSFGDKIEFFTRKYRLLKYLGKLDKATNEKKNIEKLLNIMKTKNIISKHKMKRLKKDIFNDELL